MQTSNNEDDGIPATMDQAKTESTSTTIVSSSSRVLVLPKPCTDVHVRTGGFQKIEERTWNLTRSSRRQRSSTPSGPNAWHLWYWTLA
ncbi:hypothetical protein H257_09122 [Aphanomyces astaci]|uniref:Uncharacterized protein n=1 Tax=Aphanomyces astaci TaxID=112090 RepID=W4GAE5_APHAT|nr:hypothetical protein H257_09122 [Aphanomyces astaci]ETV76630.1 hypothetical protein H257_09122 [Aphanomyces astaci]|eukprot:XP_009833542.1 hypothetical protein H257_09122 [Aphanomyces astaci]